MGNNLINRIKDTMHRNQINARELAERAGVGQSFVYDILSGKSTNPTAKKLSSIAEILGVEVQYLLHGKREDTNKNRPDELIAIPAIDTIASTNLDAIVLQRNNNKPYYFHKSWLKELQTLPKNLRIIFITGDGMSPTLSDGDMVLIDTSRTSPNPSGVFALFDGMGIAIKRLEYAGSPKALQMRISSDNKKYAPYERKAGDVEILGKVIWFSRQFI